MMTPVDSAEHRAAWPHVSVVIPVRNNREGVRRCIEALRANVYPGTLDITVVDNGSSDGSDALATELGAALVRRPDARVSAVRNAGAAATRGDVLAFIDSDQRVASDWLKRGVSTLADFDGAVVGSATKPPEAPTWVQRAYDALRVHHSGVVDCEWLGAGGVLVWRSKFEAAGGFDEALETCEDVDLCRRLSAGGGRVLSDGELINIHDGDPATLGALFRGELWRGRDNLRVTLKAGMTLRDIPSVAFPVSNVLAAVGVVAGLALIPVRGPGLLLLSSLPPLLTTLARAAVIFARLRNRSLADVARALAVGAVYEAARASALVVRVSHGVRRR